MERALAAIHSVERRSSAVSRVYYSAARRAELPDVAPVTLTPPELPDEQVIAGMVAEAFRSLSDSLEAGKSLAEALGVGSDQAQGVAVRNALRPSRNMLYSSSEQDSRSLGWIWETAGDDRVCYRCSMQESRGPVFSDGSFDTRNNASGEMKVWFHSLCRCHLRNFFTEAPELQDRTARLYQQWSLATAPFTAPSSGALTGNESVNAWRRYWQSIQRGENEVLALARAHRDQDTVSRMIGRDEEVV